MKSPASFISRIASKACALVSAKPAAPVAATRSQTLTGTAQAFAKTTQAASASSTAIRSLAGALAAFSGIPATAGTDRTAVYTPLVSVAPAMPMQAAEPAWNSVNDAAAYKQLKLASEFQYSLPGGAETAWLSIECLQFVDLSAKAGVTHFRFRGSRTAAK